MNRRGFTLLELLIVIALTISISAVSIPLYGNLQSSTKLDEHAYQMIDLYYYAQEKSRAGFEGDGYGLYFDPGGAKIILYKGSSYATRESNYDYELALESGVSLATTIPMNEINFSSGLGEPDNEGQIEFSFESNTKILESNMYGLIKEISN